MEETVEERQRTRFARSTTRCCDKNTHELSTIE